MNKPSKTLTILMADDDEDDRILAQDAMKESRVLNELYFVEDGVELLAYLNGEGKYADRDSYTFTNDTVERTFPTFIPGKGQGTPVKLIYSLVAGEAGWALELD